MMNDGSLGGSANLSVFDLQSQQGVTNLLSSVRVAKIAPAEKNELRDLIFQFMNGGKDQTVRISLEQGIKKYSITPIASIAKNPALPPLVRHPFGTSRPSPTFTPAKVSTVAAESKSTPPTPHLSESVSIPETKFTEGEKIPSPVTPQPIPSPTTTPVPTIPTPTPTPLPSPTPNAVPAPMPATVDPAEETSPEGNQNLKRIKEIKYFVNKKIGNPVNLVDINNEVGREYMSAMLDAMKKINSGSSAASAMDRLEQAYLSVQETLANEESGAVNVSEATVDNVESTPIQTAAPVPTPPAPDHTPTQDASPTLEPLPLKVNLQVKGAPAPAAASVSRSLPEVSRTPAPSAATTPESEPAYILTPDPTQVVGYDQMKTPSPEPVPKTPSTPPPVQNLEPAPTLKEVSNKAHSLADSEVKLHKPEDLLSSSSLEDSSVAGDPLFTKEVDEGLQQLLLEWSLFKKSGMFGMGAKGIDHPLYKSVQNLQVPLLLAGRFEGATQEIKQSITDYMNGWRYERGIIYEQGENFEHYLRRVIRHIIDLQNRKESP